MWPASGTSVHWWSTRHQPRTASFRPGSRPSPGFTPGLVRLSVAIENIDDILADLEAGFRAAKGAADPSKDVAGQPQ
ncbi:cystathionine beta-lyase/cystathionine gamma-synthase [Arthrobacter sp. UYNi723]